MNITQNWPGSAIAASQQASSNPVIKGFGNRPKGSTVAEADGDAVLFAGRNRQKPRQRRIPRCQVDRIAHADCFDVLSLSRDLPRGRCMFRYCNNQSIAAAKPA